jgi:hypothetical protein
MPAFDLRARIVGPGAPQEIAQEKLPRSGGALRGSGIHLQVFPRGQLPDRVA